MKVVVTGGAGFIGANLCGALLRGGIDEVFAVDDLSTGVEKNLHGSHTTLCKGSILDAALLDELFVDADAVVHLAARPSVPRSINDPVATHTVNATGTVTVLEAVRRAGVPYTVVVSSSSVYGANPALPKREDLATLPASPYAASKLATEGYALAYRSSFGLPILTCRFFNVFGPLQPASHDYAAVVPAFVDAALAGRPLVVHGDGTQTRDFTFVDSVAAVITRAVLDQRVAEGPMNLAFGSRTSLLVLIEHLEHILGRSLPVDYVEPRPGDVHDSQADSSRLRALFPDIEPVDLDEGLRRTVDWFQEQGTR